MPSEIVSIGSVAIQLLRAYMELMRLSGRTPEEIEAAYKAEAVRFYNVNAPQNLPKAEGDI